jgi:hypothetical protein
MRSGPVIVCHECFQLPIQRRFAENDQMIEALPPDGADDTLDVSSLPRGSRRREHLLHAHVLDLLGEVVAKDSIPVSQQVAGCRVSGESISKLLGCPFRGRMSGDVEVENAPPFVG